MIDGSADSRETKTTGGRPPWLARGILVATCALVIGIYAYTAHSGFLTSMSLNAADGYYNLLVQGFRAGQLNVKKEVPVGLARLADPYDRAANTSFGVLDLSYYKGKFYLYFGVTPAVVLFWPYVVLTGRYLLQKDAAVIFCAAGFLVSVCLLYALWRRYFAKVNVGVVAACALALGLATLVPVMLARSDVYEVSISCGYAMTMLAVAAIWKALHVPGRRRGLWLAAASLAYGLAVGARPSLLLGAVILLVPVAEAWRERRKLWTEVLSATGPIMLIGLGLMLYNALRFDNPFEFGWHYQLAGERQNTVHLFNLRYLWYNFRVFFLEPARWSSRFPFVHDIQAPPLPAGHGGGEHPFGVLTNIPLVWLALAVPLAWCVRSAEEHSRLRGLATAAGLLFGICALTICLHPGANVRYEVEFLPALVLLAVIGILGLERVLAPSSESGLICRPVWRRAVRCSWGLLLGFSVTFSLLASVGRCAKAHYDLGNALYAVGRTSEAIDQYDQAVRLKPDYAEAHNNLGINLEQVGRLREAIEHYEEALRITPHFPEAHNNLGGALAQMGRVREAIGHWEEALRIRTNYFEARYNLARGFALVGEFKEAVADYEQALAIKPDSVDAHNNLGNALLKVGRATEAIEHYEQALRFNPDLAKAHYNLGVALEQLGRVPEAIGQYERALQIDANFTAAQEGLARLRAVQ